jgi:hypothetical protein
MNEPRFIRWGAVAFLILLGAASAGEPEAREPDLGPPGFKVLDFLADERVHRDLGLDAPQLQALRQVLNDSRNGLRGRLAIFLSLPEEKYVERYLALRHLEPHVLRGLTEMLRPEQLRRLRQIQLNVVGPPVFVEPEIQRALQLDDRQAAEVDARYNEMRKTWTLILFDHEPGPERERRMRIARDATSQRLMEILTEAQKRTWKQCLGRPFSLEPPPPSR